MNPSRRTTIVTRDAGTRGRSAFTIFELMVTISIIAIIAVAVMPAVRSDDRLRVMAAASVLRSDIQAAQVMTIANPAAPVVVVFNAPKSMYWLAFASTPDTPLTREENGSPYFVVLGQGRGSAAANVQMQTANLNAETITFNPQGGLTGQVAPPSITLTAGPESIRLEITPMTGSMVEVANPAG